MSSSNYVETTVWVSQHKPETHPPKDGLFVAALLVGQTKIRYIRHLSNSNRSVGWVDDENHPVKELGMVYWEQRVPHAPHYHIITGLNNHVRVVAGR